MIIPMEDYISHHPLFERWKTLRKRDVLCAEWKADFRAFLKGVGERPEDCKKLVRADAAKPYGPGNAAWGKTPSREDTLQYYRDWNRRNPNVRREKHFADKYGITLADYDRMLSEQDGGCGICGGQEQRFSNRGRQPRQFFCVDHDHETGAVRGLLCSDCNVALGAFKDNPTTILRAIGYLRHHNRQRLKVVE